MSNEWIPLPTMMAVAKAQADGWEIQYRGACSDWDKWNELCWMEVLIYRGRPNLQSNFELTDNFNGREQRSEG